MSSRVGGPRKSGECIPNFDLGMTPTWLRRVSSLSLPKDCPSHTPNVINTQYNGEKAYDTNDLVMRHPTNPGLWRVYGRSDDQLTHSAGGRVGSSSAGPSVHGLKRFTRQTQYR